MHLNVDSISTVALAVTAVLALIAAMLGWFFRRGGDEREDEVSQAALRQALDANTTALKSLTLEFRDFKDAVIEKIHSLDIRVTRLEVQPPPIHLTTKLEAPHDDSSAHRDAGSQG